MPFPLIPLIAAGVPLVQSLIQNRMNRKMSEYTYKNDVNMWNKTNEYNTPKNQMARYGAAGLNPNLIYGQGNSGNASTSMPKYNPPDRSLKVPDTMQIINQYQDLKNKMKTEDLLAAQIENTKSETSNKEAMNIILKLRPDLMNTEMFKNQAQTNLYGSQNTGQNTQNSLLNLKYVLSDPAKFREAMSTKWAGIFPDKTLSSTEYSLQSQQLRNSQTEEIVKKIMQDTQVSKQTKNWLQLKYDTMQKSNVNIDKDAIWMRVLGDVFGDSFKQIKEGVKNIQNNVSSPFNKYKNFNLDNWLYESTEPDPKFNYKNWFK
ncbi:MAG: DNA pilot protein [Microvirus sp.]|nr:MAG: DNA pilot protein [Microvirus sp.]